MHRNHPDQELLRQLKDAFQDNFWEGRLLDFFDTCGLSFEDFWYYFQDTIIDNREKLEL